jgi:hypothetical protein
MFLILLIRHPFKVRERVILFVAVNVIDLWLILNACHIVLLYPHCSAIALAMPGKVLLLAFARSA